MYIIKIGNKCCNVDNDADMQRLLDGGGVLLTMDEIKAAGMAGYECLVGPDNTAVSEDGRITFNKPSDAALAEQRYTNLRASRDARLAATDKYLLADYPIGEDDLMLVKAYRGTLRTLPEQPGAPWDGGGDETPWPEAPGILQTEQSCA